MRLFACNCFLWLQDLPYLRELCSSVTELLPHCSFWRRRLVVDAGRFRLRLPSFLLSCFRNWYCVFPLQLDLPFLDHWILRLPSFYRIFVAGIAVLALLFWSFDQIFLRLPSFYRVSFFFLWQYCCRPLAIIEFRGTEFPFRYEIESCILRFIRSIKILATSSLDYVSFKPRCNSHYLSWFYQQHCELFCIFFHSSQAITRGGHFSCGAWNRIDSPVMILSNSTITSRILVDLSFCVHNWTAPRFPKALYRVLPSLS